MNYHNLDELKDLIASCLTLENILDVLEWNKNDLVEVLTPHIRDKQDVFEEIIQAL